MKIGLKWAVLATVAVVGFVYIRGLRRRGVMQ